MEATMNTTSTTKRFDIVWVGRPADRGFESHADAVEFVTAELSRFDDRPVFGHSGDINDGGERTLFWATEQDARDDDGRRAVGEIRRAHADWHAPIENRGEYSGLRDEALEVGDYEQARLCARALLGDPDAQRECDRVIADARAQNDE
jgi:hypothetical protein